MRFVQATGFLVLFLEHGDLSFQPNVLLCDIIVGLLQLQPLGVQSLLIFIHFSGEYPGKIVGGEIRFH